MFNKKLISIATFSACVAMQQTYAAEDNSDKPIIANPVVVTATRVEENSFDLPVAIDVVGKETIQDGQLRMSLAESLLRIPGITAQSRGQMAQDPQISTRGFGARSSFGVRGLRLYVDGIPLSMPDGIGQPGVVDLDAIRSIEVMRGPFSALYGNSSGGVLQLLSENAPKTPEISAGAMFGSYDTKRDNIRAAGNADGIEYLFNYSNFQSDGYRDHSNSKKEQATAKFKLNLNEDTTLTSLVNWFDQDAQDPLGLSRKIAFSDPTSVAKSALMANTRVYRSHTQVGFNLEHHINQNNSINLISYVGTRENEQYLSTSAVSNSGRASQISRDFWGSDLRWNNQGSLFDRPYTISTGITYGKMNDDRLDINATAGVKNGILNRDEKNIASNSDQYIQGKWAAMDQLDLHAGLRRTQVTLEIDDNNLTNGDSSGSVTYRKTTPVIGAVWKVNPALNFYTNYGKGFETPTFIEAAYATTAASSKPNLGLKPSESRNFEIGTKAFITDNTRAGLTFFKTLTDDEIVVQDSLFGRSTYTNAGKTKRDGAELSAESWLPHNISLYAAYTLLNAKFDSTFTNSLGNTIVSGNTIPGTYHTQIYGEAAWKHEASGFRTAFEARHNSKSYVDDVNSDIAPSYTIYNIRAGFEQRIKNWRLSEFARVENIFDKAYIGSVRINDSNSRFYEPSAGRNWLIGLNMNYAF